MFAVFAWRAVSEAARDGDGRLVAVMIAIHTVLATAGMTVKGLALTPTLLLIGLAHLGILLGTGGHPVRMYGQWLSTPRPMPIKQQIRTGAVMLLVLAAAAPLWVPYT